MLVSLYSSKKQTNKFIFSTVGQKRTNSFVRFLDESLRLCLVFSIQSLAYQIKKTLCSKVIASQLKLLKKVEVYTDKDGKFQTNVYQWYFVGLQDFLFSENGIIWEMFVVFTKTIFAMFEKILKIVRVNASDCFGHGSESKIQT